MELHRFILTKSKLAALPQAERSLLLLLGHASNEINVLSKLILIVMRKDTPPSQIANNVEAGQVCVLLRVLVGQLHEAWELFRRRVSRRRKGSRPIARATRRSLPRVGRGDGKAARSHAGRCQDRATCAHEILQRAQRRTEGALQFAALGAPTAWVNKDRSPRHCQSLRFLRPPSPTAYRL